MKFLTTLIAAVVATVGIWAAAAEARTLSGVYLAARHALQRGDLTAANRYLTSALAMDPKNTRLMEQALNTAVSIGHIKRAVALSKRLDRRVPGHRLATLVLTVDEFATGAYGDAARRVEFASDSYSPLIAGLLLGWAHTGAGDLSAAEVAFQGLNENSLFEAYGLYHGALARGSRGDQEGAQEWFAKAGELFTGMGSRMLRARGATLELLGRTDEAVELYQQALQAGLGDLASSREIARVRAGEPPVFLVSSARHGAAEALLALADALSRDQSRPVGLLYGQLALHLRNDLDEANLLVADLLREREENRLAAQAFGAIGPESSLHIRAEIGRSQALRALGEDESAFRVLADLTELFPGEVRPPLAYGDALRRAERFEQAATAYTTAIDLIETPEDRHWSIFYQRGIAYERSDQWDLAEQDFFKALELRPDQPLVLNYLGYSWVELKRNFEEAQAMIEKAVEQRPDDGYITDSLGWVLYRIGNFEGAVPHLERAVELMPVDPIINDHLGDAFWMVGRKLEARFQWRRALSFEPEDKDADRIRRKLEVGLDRVLSEEAATDEEASASPTPDDG